MKKLLRVFLLCAGFSSMVAVVANCGKDTLDLAPNGKVQLKTYGIKEPTP